MSKYKLIIFDLDDTLFDYKATEIQALSKACSTLNLAFDEETYKLYKTSNEIAKKMIPDYLLKLDNFRRKRAEIFLGLLSNAQCPVDVFINEYLKASEIGVVIDGVSETLETIKSVQKVVGTNGSTYPRHNKLLNSQIAKYFIGFYSSEILGITKPNPDFFIKICNNLSVNPNEVLVVGDNIETDILGAFNAGIDSCLITSLPVTVPLPSNTQIISSIKELLGVIL